MDSAAAAQARAWLESILGERLGDAPLCEAVRGGERLARVLNTVWPHSVTPARDGLGWVEAYLAGCWRLGLRGDELPDAAALCGPLVDGAARVAAADAVARNVLALQRVVTEQVPDAELQQLLAHVARIRGQTADVVRSASGARARALLEVAPGAAATSPPGAMLPRRRLWRTTRPPPPPPPPHRRPAELVRGVGAGGAPVPPALERLGTPLLDDATGQSSSSSPHSLSGSISSLSTLESRVSGRGAAAGTGATVLNVAAILRAAARATSVAERDGADSVPCMTAASSDSCSLDGFELASLGESGEDTWLELASPSVVVVKGGGGCAVSAGSADLATCSMGEDDEGDSVSRGGDSSVSVGAHESQGADTGLGSGSARLSLADVSRALQHELCTLEGQRKLWRHLLEAEQAALLQAPWREGVLSARTYLQGPLRSTVELLLRRGIPSEYRAGAWLCCTGAIKRMASRPALYASLLRDGAGTGIGAGAGRGPGRGPSGAAARVACALATRDRGLTRRGSLRRVAAWLLAPPLALSEEATFWLLIQALEFMVPLDYFASGLALQVDCLVLAALPQEVDPELAQHLSTLAEPSEWSPLASVIRRLGLLNAMQSLFTARPLLAHGPTLKGTDADAADRFTLRVLDLFCFLGEGVLLGAALALIQAARVDVLASASLDEVRDGIAAAPLDEPLLALVYDNVSLTGWRQLARLRARCAPTVIAAALLVAQEDQPQEKPHEEGKPERSVDAAFLGHYLHRQRQMVRSLECRTITRIERLCCPREDDEDAGWTLSL
jgi:hypothetical protein